MDEIPETGDAWFRLVNRRLARLERRLHSTVTGALINAGSFLLPTGDIPDGWEEDPDLAGDAPSGYVYVRRARPPEAI